MTAPVGSGWAPLGTPVVTQLVMQPAREALKLRGRATQSVRVQMAQRPLAARGPSCRVGNIFRVNDHGSADIRAAMTSSFAFEPVVIQLVTHEPR
jgi:hypothetical protein